MSGSTSENDLPLVEAAIERDDFESLSSLVSEKPNLFRSSKWKQNNPLAVACSRGSRRFAEKFARDYPKFLKVKDKNGQTPLHIACSKGDLPLVELFVLLDSKVCPTHANRTLTPLHVAVIHGFADVIRALVGACPNSIEAVTPHGETVFHLAAKHYNCRAFDVLLELALQHNKLHILRSRDGRRGDTVLHIAASNKLTEVIEKLLPEQNSGGGQALVQVNTMNKHKLTALDVCYQSNGSDVATQDSGSRILIKAGGLEARSLKMTAHVGRTLETKNVILVALSVIIGAAFTAVCNLPASFMVNQKAGLEFGVDDMISAHLPPIFYMMVFNSAVFLLCLVVILVLLWSLPLRPVVVFLTTTFGIVYCIMVNNVMPKLILRVGSVSIPGVLLVGLLAVGFICVGAILYCLYPIFKGRLKTNPRSS